MSDAHHAAEIKRLQETVALLREQLNRVERDVAALGERGAASQVVASAPPTLPQAAADMTRKASLLRSLASDETSIHVPPAHPPLAVPPPVIADELVAIVDLDSDVELETDVESAAAVAYGTSRQKPAAPPRNLEMIIGGKWLNWLGGLLTFVGLAFLMKLSIDRGWVSVSVRLVGAAFTGLAMIGAGEFSLFKNYRNFATGLLGAGVGILYLTIFGAHQYYGLISSTLAMSLYVATTGLSIAIAVHGNMLAVAILALIGGFGTPIMLNTGDNQQVALMSYILLMNVCFLSCAAARRWDSLRPLAWLGSAVLFLGWFFTHYVDTAVWTTTIFLGAIAALFLAELILTARLGRIKRPILHAALVHATNGAMFAGIVGMHVSVATPWKLGAFAALCGFVQWLCAWKLVGRHESAAAPRLAFWLDGATMLAFVAPLALDGSMVSLAWATQAAVTLGFCRRSQSVWLRFKGAALFLLASFHLLLLVSDTISPTTDIARPISTIGRWILTPTILYFCFVGACSYVAAALLTVWRSPNREDRALALACWGLGSVLILGVFAFAWDRYLATWWWAGLAALWLAGSMRWPGLRSQAAVLAMAALWKFLIWDLVDAGVNGAWENLLSGVIANRAVATSVVVIGLAILARRNLRSSEQDDVARVIRLILNIGTVLAIVAIGTFEALRVANFESAYRAVLPKSAAGILITGWWALVAAAMLVPPMWCNRECRSMATMLAGIALAKLLIVDTLGFAMFGGWSSLSGVAFNRQMAVGVLTIAVALGVSLLHQAERRRERIEGVDPRWTIWFVIVLIAGVWLGTFEICRVFRFEPLTATLPDRSHAMQISLSIFWSMFAAALIALGFLRREATMRYVALSLFLLTLVKVVTFDLRHLDVVYRIICAIAFGGLLLLASLVYQRMAKKLDAARPAA